MKAKRGQFRPSTFLKISTKTRKGNNLEQAVRFKALEYFKPFAERTDWNKFCSF